jgi:hypothetical protein
LSRPNAPTTLNKGKHGDNSVTCLTNADQR